MMLSICWQSSFFFFNDTATTEIYTLSLHGALPISVAIRNGRIELSHVGIGETTTAAGLQRPRIDPGALQARRDRKSTKLNTSHANKSYALLCLEKKSK